MGEGSNLKQIKAVITLRSGKTFENLTPESTSGKISNPIPVQTEEATLHVPAPFPTRLTISHKEKNRAEILEVFKQVRINIPLLDAI